MKIITSIFAACLVFSVIYFLTGCTGSTTSIRYGKDTSLTRLAHNNDEQSYQALTLAQQEGNWEYNVSTYLFEDGDREFSTNSIGVAYKPSKEWGWFYVDGGLGLRLTTKERDNNWLADSNILGSLNVGFGVKKTFKQWALKLGLMLEHLSVPCRHDKGINLNTFKVEVKF